MSYRLLQVNSTQEPIYAEHFDDIDAADLYAQKQIASNSELFFELWETTENGDELIMNY